MYRGHPLDPPPSAQAMKLIHLWEERRQLADLGYTFPHATESTLITEAFRVIESTVGRLRDRPAKAKPDGE